VPGTGAARAQCGKLFHPARLAYPAQRCAGISTGRGPKAPGQRPPRPRRALLARRVGRWPFVVPGPAGLGGTVPSGRGKRGPRFPFPPALMTAPSPPQWQGPSPLPWHHAGIRTGRGPKALGQRPPRPRRALRPRRVGRRPLSFLELAVDRKPSRAGGETRPAFQGPVRRGNPLPQTGKNSPQAGGRIAVSAACQGVACQSRNRLVIQHRMTGRHGMQTANARPVPDGSDRASGVGVRLAVPGRWTRHVVVKPRCRSDRVSRAPS